MNLEAQAALTAALFALDTHGFGGVCLRSSAGPVRDQWLQMLRYLLPEAAAVRRIPCNIPDSRLLGGLDLAATLRAGTPIATPGVLASIDAGVLVVAMAERLSAQTAGVLCGALDSGEIHVARESMLLRQPARIAIVALDESISEDEFVPRCLLDRCAFLLDFSAANVRTVLIPAHGRAEIDAARVLLPEVTIDTTYVQALCATAMTLGAGSLRVSVLAVHAARALAALDGRKAVEQGDAEMAGRLVLAPRASRVPQTSPPDTAPSEDAAPLPEHAAPLPEDAAPLPENTAASAPDTTRSAHTTPAPEASPPPDLTPPPARELGQLDDLILAATQSAIPAGLLLQIRAHSIFAGVSRGGGSGRAGVLRKGGTRGRPAGVSPPGAAKSRLNVFETLRAAVPWQAIRGRRSASAPSLQLRPEDLRMTRYQQRSRTLTIFVVDASGSSALNRLSEAKGAVELLLADCYVRRDEVAVIAFRGRTAETLLPPTRSLVRAKRSMSALPGGGGTPLAAAIDAAAMMASRAKRRGESPTVVLLTDGRGNVARDGALGRAPGQADALRAAGAYGRGRITTLLVDTSPRPHDLARELAGGMRAGYFALPFADARALSKLVGAVNS